MRVFGPKVEQDEGNMRYMSVSEVGVSILDQLGKIHAQAGVNIGRCTDRLTAMFLEACS